MGYLNSDRVQVDGFYSTQQNYVGPSHTYSNQAVLTPQYYDYGITAGGEIELLCEPTYTTATPRLVIVVGNTAKIGGTIEVEGGSRTNYPAAGTRRSLWGKWAFYAYHEGDSDGHTFSIDNIHAYDMSLATGSNNGMNTESYNSSSHPNPPANRDQYKHYFVLPLQSWQANIFRVRIEAIKGANYTWTAFWE